MINTTPPRAAAIAGIAAVLALAAAACAGGGGTTTTVRTVPAAASAVTGVAEVDRLVAAAESGDAIELAALTGYTRVACDPQAGDTGDAPKCRDSEGGGAEVEVLASSGCDRAWVRPEQVPDTYRSALADGVRLYAVYEPNAAAEASTRGSGAQYVIVLVGSNREDGPAAGVALHVKDGRVTWLERSCAQVGELVGADRVRSFVVAPAGPTPAAETPTAPPP